MFLEYVLSLDIYHFWIVILLITVGFLVGFINTIAGSGAIISYSVFMLLGLPAHIANGTIRVGVIMQTLSASITFKKNRF